MSKEEKLETIWDYNPTEEEIKKLSGKSVESAKRDSLSVYKCVDWRRFADIAALLELRGEKEKADIYRLKVYNDPRYIAFCESQKHRHHFNRISKK